MSLRLFIYQRNQTRWPGHYRCFITNTASGHYPQFVWLTLLTHMRHWWGENNLIYRRWMDCLLNPQTHSCYTCQPLVSTFIFASSSCHAFTSNDQLCCRIVSSNILTPLALLKQVNQQAMAPMHGGHAASWTNAASKAVSCGAWRCTVHLPRLARQLALCAHSATQTCREHPRLVPGRRAQSAGQHSSQTRQKTRRWGQHQTHTHTCLFLQIELVFDILLTALVHLFLQYEMTANMWLT